MNHRILTAGQVLAGRYVVVRKLGDGGMASVYAIRTLSAPDGEMLALKAANGVDAIHRQRLRAEFETLSHLRHRGVVRVYEWGEDEESETVFYVMEYVDGVPLTGVVRGGWMTLRESLQLFRQILEAVAYLHAEGVTHRDLKPSNILVSRDGRAVLIDFGISRGPSRSEITPVRGFTGTLLFVSPEQAGFYLGRDKGRLGPADAAEVLGPRSDVYALGVLLFHLLTDGWPYAPPDDNPHAQLEFLQRLCTARPRSPTEFSSGAPRNLSELVLGLINRVPEARPATATQVLPAFDAAMHADDHQDVLDRPSPLVQHSLDEMMMRDGLAPTQIHIEPPRRLRVIGAIAGLLLVSNLITGGAALLLRSPAPPAAASALETLNGPTFVDPAPDAVIEQSVPSSPVLFGGMVDASSEVERILMQATLIVGPVEGQKRYPCVKYPNLEVPWKGGCWHIFSLEYGDNYTCEKKDSYEPEKGYCKKYRRVYIPVKVGEKPPVPTDAIPMPAGEK